MGRNRMLRPLLLLQETSHAAPDSGRRGPSLDFVRTAHSCHSRGGGQPDCLGCSVVLHLHRLAERRRFQLSAVVNPGLHFRRRAPCAMLLRMRMRRPVLAVALLAGLPIALSTALPATLPASAQQATPPAQSQPAQSSSQQAPGTAAPAAVPSPAEPSPADPASAVAPKAKEVSVLAIVRDKK